MAFFANRRGTGTYSIVVATHDGGLVLLDPQRNKVARTYGNRRIDSEYVALRQRYARYLAAPSFEVAPDGTALIEDLVRGRHFAELDGADQVRVTRDLLKRYASLTEHEGESHCQEIVTSAVNAVLTGSMPTRIKQLLADLDLVGLSAQWPVVPSATDASVKNLIILDDGTPTPIDLGHIRMDPFFYFPIGVVIMARGAVLEDFLDGGLDDDVTDLFRSANCDFPLTSAGRESLLIVRVALSSLRETERCGPWRQAVFDQAFQQRWSQLWSGKPAAFS